MKHSSHETSWESSSSWYDKVVGPKGHYYHQQVVLPGTLRLLQIKSGGRLLDLACGQGILARALPKGVDYFGVDASLSLIQKAKALSPRGSNHAFAVHDLSAPLQLKEKPFSHAACLLALQNIEDPLTVLRSAAACLAPEGTLVLVLNHPCFRIPRQSQWGVDEKKKLQYRRMDAYLGHLKVPIQTHPSMQQDSPTTWSFHRPLSAYSALLKEAGFVITALEEWCSDKLSTGKHAAMENRSRKEFPLFLAIAAKKLS